MNHHLVDQIWHKLDFSILHPSHYNQRGLGVSPLMQQLSHATPVAVISYFALLHLCPAHQTLSWKKLLWNGCFKVFPIIVHAQYYQQNFHNFTFDSVAPWILWMVPICWMGLPLKGIVHQFFFYRTNLIFWKVMGCCIAAFGWRGL